MTWLDWIDTAQFANPDVAIHLWRQWVNLWFWVTPNGHHLYG
jgi:hypothetical protein